MPVAVKTLVAAAPQGTWAAHSAIFSSGLAKSASPVTLPGLSGGTAIWSLLRTKTSGSAASPASVTVFMVAGLAAAKTSAGAPATICWARAELAPKLKVTVVPGFSVRKSSPIWLNAPVREAAAKTFTVPVTAVRLLVACAVSELFDARSLPPAQAVSASADSSARARMRGTRDRVRWTALDGNPGIMRVPAERGGVGTGPRRHRQMPDVGVGVA